jgi:phosphatidate cytidylyltransferase
MEIIPMLTKRLTTAAILIPIILSFMFLGGWYYLIFITVFLTIAAWEYWQIFKKGEYSPNAPLLFASIIILTFVRYEHGFLGSDIILAAAVMIALAFHTIGYELGHEKSSLDFGITMGGILYLGWLGSYLISLRFLPNGLWWMLLVVPAVSIADSGAYFIGSKFGRNKMSPKVSPKKTWEGYLGGVIFCLIGGAILGMVLHNRAPEITIVNGLIMGTILGIITPMGDLGESMLKRQFNIKDSSNLLPGHGGFLDRIDSMLWAACIGYYLIIWFFIPK